MLRYFHWTLIWLLAVGASLAQPALAHQVAVVSSDKTPAFQEAVDNLTVELVRAGTPRNEIQLLSVAEYTDGSVTTQDARLLVTLGSDAFRQVMAQSARQPVIAGLLPRVSFERVLQETPKRSPGNVAALYLDQPLTRQLDLLRLALPNLHRVGVLWGPESIAQQPQMAAALQARGLEASEGTYTEGSPMIAPLRAALRDSEVLLAVADASVYNPSTVSNILLTSYRSKIPVLAFSPAYVKAGAMLSVYTTASQAGIKMASLVSHFLQTNTLSASQYPGEFSISVNDYVAHSLGLNLDERDLTERLRRLEKRP